ncbi:enoyl-CoA hydratase [Gordonia rubripertincta]|uniref:Enoyl-CoA hydratase n=2 Tax=Gordonia rubripertincta TaxID=36822 RepID=A0AAW6R8V9_GORRU|nr:enoyl-CoA hydratase [Gordonia rubripertincta]MBM7280307.1 enoyl-CoA hydratase [Gordonia rubripertincta]MDG6780583.1 enoyl-CoA hydratase [Gordonia rubripertincta]NKY65906.1 enoyl-CoA hydratase [Gordonia rubripertincta]QMU20767.1 enoyl-CoA hydratase [Gordonia rubripertincta]TSD93607.1 enoyl-CoA hydratase [Gordonia rubripertincta]
MIHSTTDGAVVTIELDRVDKRNALNEEMLGGLADAFDAATEAGARAIVVTGRGPVFSAGADLSGPVYDPGFLDKLVSTLHRIESTPVPVIAALNGSAIGGGLQLAMAADLRVMAPDAIAAIPAAKLGVAVDEWTIRRLVSLVGAGQARGMLIGCDPLNADRAHTLGFANRIGDLADAQHWAATIADLAPLTLQHYKLVLNGDGARDTAPEDRVAAMMRAWQSDDMAEGRAARTEKRPPKFAGR